MGRSMCGLAWSASCYVCKFLVVLLLLVKVRHRVKDKRDDSAVMRPDEVDEVDLGGEDVGDDDRGKNLIAKRLRDLGLLELLSVLWAVLAVLATRLERRFLLRGLKMELERLERGANGASVINEETDEEI